MTTTKKTKKTTEKKVGGKTMKGTHIQESPPIELSHTGEFVHTTAPSASGEMGTEHPICSIEHLDHHGTDAHHAEHHAQHHAGHHAEHHAKHHTGRRDVPEPLPREHNLRTHHGYNLRYPAK